MNAGVNINSFQFKVKNSRKDTTVPFFSDFSENNKNCLLGKNNVIEAIKKFYTENQSPKLINRYKKYFFTKKDSYKLTDDGNIITIAFTICCGDYGIKSDIISVDTQEIVYNKSINNADVKDFRIMFVFHKNKNIIHDDKQVYKGIVLMEVIGKYGIKTITYSIFREFFSHYFHVIPIFNSMASKDELEQLIKNGAFKQVHLIKNKTNSAFSSMFDVNGGREETTINLIKFKNTETFVDKILSLISQEQELYEIGNTYYNDLSFTVKTNGRTKKISVRNIEDLYLVEDLPDDVLERDGTLVPEKMDFAMLQRANSYLSNLVDGK